MRFPQLILRAFTTLGETLYPYHFGYEEAYFRAAFDEIVRHEWGKP